MSLSTVFQEEIVRNYTMFYNLYKEIHRKNRSIFTSIYHTSPPSVAVIKTTAYGDSQESARRFVRLLISSIQKSTSIFIFLLTFFLNDTFPCIQLGCENIHKKSCTYRCASKRLDSKYKEAIPYRYSPADDSLVMDNINWVDEIDTYANKLCNVLSYLRLPYLSSHDWLTATRIRYPDDETQCFICLVGQKLLQGVRLSDNNIAIRTLIKKINASDAVYVLDSIVHTKMPSYQASTVYQCFVFFYDDHPKASEAVLQINFRHLVGLTDEGIDLSNEQIKALNENLYYLYYARPDNRRNFITDDDIRDHRRVDKKLVKHFQDIAPLRSSDYSTAGQTLNTKPLTSLLASIGMDDIFSIVSKNKRLRFLTHTFRPAQIRGLQQKQSAFQRQFLKQKYMS